MDSNSKRQWHIVRRWQEYHAEIRTIYIRICAITAFYSVQLYDHFIEKSTTPEFHRRMTYLAALWLAASVFTLLAVRSRYLPDWVRG